MAQAVTYKTENPQEVFDFVVKMLHGQGGKSTNGLICMYRAANGRKCALGWLIPDEEYDPKMECNILIPSVGRLGVCEASDCFVGPEFKNNAYLIRALQLAHDNSVHGTPPSRWFLGDDTHSINLKLSEVAREFGLDDSVVRSCWPDKTNSSPT